MKGIQTTTVIQSKVSGTKPQLLCGEPRILRTVPIDVATK